MTTHRRAIDSTAVARLRAALQSAAALATCAAAAWAGALL